MLPLQWAGDRQSTDLWSRPLCPDRNRNDDLPRAQSIHPLSHLPTSISNDWQNGKRFRAHARTSRAGFDTFHMLALGDRAFKPRFNVFGRNENNRIAFCDDLSDHKDPAYGVADVILQKRIPKAVNFLLVASQLPYQHCIL